MKQFNVLDYNWNTKTIDKYDVLPYFRDTWNDSIYNFDKENVHTKDNLKDWILRASQYQFWARCQYEFMIAPWPYREETLVKDLIKIDVHKQIKMNIDIITDILATEFKIF